MTWYVVGYVVNRYGLIISVLCSIKDSFDQVIKTLASQSCANSPCNLYGPCKYPNLPPSPLLSLLPPPPPPPILSLLSPPPLLEVPDLSHLDPKVVQLLALQRLQQLLSQSSQQDTTLSQANKPTLADTDSLTNQVKEQTQLLLNGWTQFNAQKPQKKGKQIKSAFGALPYLVNSSASTVTAG